MIYAQLFSTSTGWNGKDFSGPVEIIERLGSDAIIMLDGRRHKDGLHNDTKRRIAKRSQVLAGVVGYRLMRGNRFDSAKPISELVMIDVPGLVEEEQELEAMMLSHKVRSAMTTHLGYEPCAEVLAGKKGTITFCTQRRYTEHSHSD